MDRASNIPLELSRINGISSTAAQSRLEREGYNELPFAAQRSTLAIALGITREPMFLLLIAAAAIYLTLGDLREAVMLAASVLIILTITIFQERKTERALEALRDFSSPRALVIRDGQERRIAGREVVRDDILVLTEGDRVPADAILLSCNDLLVDESLLTGESVPVRKSTWDGRQQPTRPGGDDLPFVYSGTMLVQGRGIAKVSAIGPNTEIGKIGKALQNVEADETFLQKKSAVMVRTLAAVGLSLCALTMILYGVLHGDWINGLLAGIALAMALLPEEIPVVLTVFLALGAWRMSQKQVLTRRMPAIETLGAATILGVDKTGTLTLNRMSVSRLYVEGQFYDVDGGRDAPLPEQFHELARTAVLASETDPFDPMEKAFKAFGERYLDDSASHKEWHLVHEYSLSPGLLALSHVWQAPGRDEHLIATKGAPEAIADLCHFTGPQREKLAKHVETMAQRGLRVLGFAKAGFAGAAWPAGQHDFDFQFLGLIGLADPVRASAPKAIEECRRAGIKVVMITGDYPATALAVAGQVGMAQGSNLLTGTDIERLHEAQLRRCITTTNIFARVLPEQKLNLVQAYKANGEIVAMTGDGVNDAPALKAAHIGIAMGGRGTDVAREAASLVVLDDDFSTIVEAVRSGRRIFDNLQKAMMFIFAVHLPIAGLALVPLFLNWPLLLTPVHIVFLELIIDPACSIAFEAETAETNIMARPPRDPAAPLFARRDMIFSLLQGLLVLVGVLAVFAIALQRGEGDTAARSLAFSTLVLAMLGLISVNRSRTESLRRSLRAPNRAYWWVIAGALVFLAAVLYVPSLSAAFRFTPLHAGDLALCFGAALTSLTLIELFKQRRSWR